MGTVTLFEATQKTIDGKNLSFSTWCELRDMQAPEHGVATVEVTENGASKEVPGWRLCIGLDEYKDLWMEHWVEAFCTQPAYREQFVCNALGNGGVIDVQSTLPTIPVMPAFEAAQKKSHAVMSFLKLGKSAKFRDFAALRSGRDAFSNMKLDALKEMLGNSRSDALMALDFDDENRVKVARWAMRGLSIEDAFHKVKVDLEVGENAHGQKAKTIRAAKP